MSTDRYLTIALGKGRLAKKAMELFEKIGITCEEMKDPASRKLIFVNEEQKLRFSYPKDRMFLPMWNMVRRISASWARTPFWRKTEEFTRCWI